MSETRPFPAQTTTGPQTGADPLRGTYQLLIDLGRDTRPRDLARAADCFRQAGDLARTMGNTALESRAHLLLGSVEQQAGRFDAAETALVSALSLAPTSDTGTGSSAGTDEGGPHLHRAACINALGWLRLRQGRLDEGLDQLRDSLALTTTLAGPGGLSIRAETLELLAMAWALRADPSQAQRHCSEALELRRACGDSAGVAKDLNQLGNLRHRLGQYQEAMTCYREALDTHRALDDDRAVAATANNLASTLLRLGELGESRSLFEECLDRFRRLGDEARAADVLANLGLLDQAEGNLASAETHYREALACKRRVGDPLGESNCLTNLSHLAIARGRPEEALEHAGGSLVILRRSGIEGTMAPALVCRGLALLELGRLIDAAEAVESARDAAEKARAKDQLAEVEALRAQVLLAEEMPDAALHAAEEANRFAAELEDPEMEAYTGRILGSVQVVRGDLEAAREALTRATRLLRGSSSSQERARVAFEEGRLLVQSGAPEAAAERLRRVEREFTRLGNGRWRILAQLHLATVLDATERGEADEIRRAALAQARADGLEGLYATTVARLQREARRAGRVEETGPAVAGLTIEELARRVEQAVVGITAAAPPPAAAEPPSTAPSAGSQLGRNEPGHRQAGHDGLLATARSLARAADSLREWLERGSASPARTGMDALGNDPGRCELLVGSSAAMQVVYRLVRQAAPTDSTVLILGESGTGKELAARSIHTLSHRRERPFLAINCPSIPRELIESELFGHERGAFTGAVEARAGKIEQADGGTLFLDEVGDMPIATQAKLLRFLQEREFERVGGRKTIRVDVRLLAATSRDLHTAIEQGEFRTDLYYRLAVVPMRMPSLRERPEDIPLLVPHFLQLLRPDGPAPPVSPAALDAFMAHDWPGNVRELRNALEYMLAVGSGETLEPRHLPASLRRRPGTAATGTLRPGESLESRLVQVEAALIRSSLEQESWNQSSAARRLGITESMVRNRMKLYGIRRPSGPPQNGSTP
jgi:DNA-binding NtrC family response regulator/tetratricopeptide (TPR) repeat protein